MLKLKTSRSSKLALLTGKAKSSAIGENQSSLPTFTFLSPVFVDLCDVNDHNSGAGGVLGGLLVQFNTSTVGAFSGQILHDPRSEKSQRPYARDSNSEGEAPCHAVLPVAPAPLP